MSEDGTNWRDARYDLPVSRQLERYDALAAKHASAAARAELVERGTYDPARHGTDERPPLTVSEHLELLALAESIARTVRHPSNVHHAVVAGASWDEVAKVIDSDPATVRHEYRQWADEQYELHQRFPDRGMTAEEHATALSKADEPS